MHPQTVIEHFGTWNAAKRAAGLMPRRFATREELVEPAPPARRRARPHTDGRRHQAARAGRCRRRRSTGIRSARSRRRCERPDSTSRWGRSGSSGRSTRAARSSRSARASAEVRRLAGGAPGGPVDADRVAGLPHVRVATRGLGDVPVPDPRAAARRRSAVAARRLASTRRRRARRAAAGTNRAPAARAPTAAGCPRRSRHRGGNARG